MSRRKCNNMQFRARAEVIAFGSLMLVPHIEWQVSLRSIQAFYVTTYIHIYIHTHTHTYIHTYIHTYTHTHTHTYTHTHTHVRTYMTGT
jgi:hypothetical protein